MDHDKKVRDIMSRIEGYEKIREDEPLCNAISRLRANFEKIRANAPGIYHKTFIVTDKKGEIVGKLSIFDLIRGLVPESVKKPKDAHIYYRFLSSRAKEVAEKAGEMAERFEWLHHSFLDLVVGETQKQVREVMSAAAPLLEEDDTINKAIYVMFKENIRQPMVVRDGKIVGVVSIMDIFPVLLDVAGDKCFLKP